MATTRPDSDRTRRAPRDRFAGEQHLFDLEAEAAALGLETGRSRNGHRQITLYRREATSIILFDFDAGGYLIDHAADGDVIVQVLAGEVRMVVAHEELVMGPGALLVLRPDVHHDLRAVTASRVLLTVHL